MQCVKYFLKDLNKTYGMHIVNGKCLINLINKINICFIQNIFNNYLNFNCITMLLN